MDNTLASRNLSRHSDVSFTYQYDANKNVLSETSTGALMGGYSWSAGFDAADRMVTWNRSTGTLSSQSWNLDPIGNWTSVSCHDSPY